jgi:hypothetical protein
VITADRWYDKNPDLKNYYQGDILSGIPFPTLSTFFPAGKQDVWGILRPRRKGQNDAVRPVGEVLRNLPNELIGRAAKDIPDAWTRPDGDGEHVITFCRKMHVALISRSCDIDKAMRKHFLVAPIVHVRDLIPAQRTDDKLRDLRANEIFHWFYLPEKEPHLPESFADFSQMVPLHRSFFDETVLKEQFAARLSGEGTLAFQQSLSSFYGINFGFAPHDTCPQNGRYSCASCFHGGRTEPSSRDVVAGNFFGDCQFCREATMWVKMP